MRKFLLLAAIVFGGCAFHDRHAETLHGAGYIVANTLIMCDYGQTMWAAHDGKWDRPIPGKPGYFYTELNPVLGHHPSPEFLGAVVVTDIVVNTAVMFAPLPKWFKSAWFGSIVPIESFNVATNNFHGFCGADL